MVSEYNRTVKLRACSYESWIVLLLIDTLSTLSSVHLVDANMDRAPFEKGDDSEYSKDAEEKEDKDFDGKIKDQDFEEKNFIQICCAWGNRLEDGRLKYYLDDDDMSKEQEQAIRNAVLEWDTKIEPLVLEEESNKEESDIMIQIKTDNMREKIAGQTTTIADRSGFIINAQITLFKETKGIDFDAVTIGRIAKHEMGHALGLGHANFDGNLMAERVNSGAASISECEVKAVIVANYWRLGDHTTDDYSDPETPRFYNVMC